MVEWNIHFANDGTPDTPVLEDIQALDISVPVTGQKIPTVNYSRGCGGMDTYALRKQPLNQLESFHLSNRGGGKTVDTIPFFDIQMDGRGMIGAVGWPGTWAISFSRRNRRGHCCRGRHAKYTSRSPCRRGNSSAASLAVALEREMTSMPIMFCEHTASNTIRRNTTESLSFCRCPILDGAA